MGAAHSLAPAVETPAPAILGEPAAPVPAELSALAPLANASPVETPAPSGYLQSVRAARERDARDGRTSYYPPVRSDYPDPASRIRAEQEAREAARAGKPVPAVELDYFCKRFANLDLD